jgi:RTX calcium-binding nonapeptide repeat (4 copies)
MTALLYAIIVMLVISSILISSSVTVLANQSNSLNSSSISTGFSDNLKSKVQDLLSAALNSTDNIINSSTLLSDGSNLSSSQFIISKNKVTSTVNSNGSDSSSGSSSVIKNQVKTVNGVCTSTKVGGNGNDTLASSGNCNDELTGGAGADKFTCGEGNDTIRDYNSEEGDVILDRQDCEKIL